MPKTIVVIPTYNEKENVPRLIPQVLAQAPDLEVLVVDDQSPDGTGAIVTELGGRDPRVHLLSRANRERRWTRGSRSPRSVTIAPVPSGDWSSTTSTSRSGA